jgi:hypothetical protein
MDPLQMSWPLGVCERSEWEEMDLAPDRWQVAQRARKASELGSVQDTTASPGRPEP